MTDPGEEQQRNFRDGHKTLQRQGAGGCNERDEEEDVGRSGDGRAMPAVSPQHPVAVYRNREPFHGPHNDLTMTWRLSATKGPTVGCLRLPATVDDAQLGDELVVVFNRGDQTGSAQHIPASADLSARLTALLGRPVSRPVDALAHSLSCPAADVAAVLQARGDGARANATGLHPAGGPSD